MNLEIDRDRLISEIEVLAAISDAEPPAVTRIVFTPTDLKSRAWLRARCEKRPDSPFGRTRSEISLPGGVVQTQLPQRSVLVLTLTRSRTPENTMEWLESWEDSRRYGRFGEVDFATHGPSAGRDRKYLFPVEWFRPNCPSDRHWFSY